MSSTEQIYIQRSKEFESRLKGTYSETDGMDSFGSVVDYKPERVSDSHFQIQYQMAPFRDLYDGTIPDDVLDLIEIAVATLAVDRYLEREIIAGEEVSDEDSRINTRSIVVYIPVFTPSLVTPEAREVLSTIISRMTYDMVEYRTIKHEREGMPTSVSKNEFTENTDAISLFSDGLDSAGGVYQNRNEGVSSEYVSLNYGNGLGKRHRKIQDLLNVDPHLFKINYEPESNEYTTFSRGFLHWAFAAATAVAHNAPEIRAFETGLMARFALLNEGWQTTRTVDPVAVELFNNLVTELLDWDTAVRNPFIEETKREVIERINNEEVVRTSVSCPHHGRQGAFELDNCGQCAPCIVRNIAILTSHFDIPTSELSICDWNEVDFEKRELPSGGPYELSGRNDRDTFFLALGEIAYLCRFIQTVDSASVVAEYPKLASEGAYELHKRFAKEFTRCFENLSVNNPTAKSLY